MLYYIILYYIILYYIILYYLYYIIFYFILFYIILYYIIYAIYGDIQIWLVLEMLQIANNTLDSIYSTDLAEPIPATIV